MPENASSFGRSTGFGWTPRPLTTRAKVRTARFGAHAALVALISAFLALATAQASDIVGQDDPRFRAALAIWLDDDDAAALPEFADLAAGGNRAAQVLLARIDATPQLHGPWLDGRSRQARIALMRAPGGISGRSWLQVAAADTPLAQLFLRQPAATLDTARGFAALGEARATRETLQVIAGRQQGGFATMADDQRYPPDMRHLVWAEWAGEIDGVARVNAELAALPPGDPQVRYVTPRETVTPELDAWLAGAPLAAPLRSACAAACPASGAACARAAYALVGEHPGLVRHGAPVEALIPSAVWNASARGRAAVLRQPHARLSSCAEQTAIQVYAIDPCLAGALATEIARYGQ